MESRRVGDSGLVVSRLGLGTLTWGRDTGEEQARGLLETFCEAGGTLIDTAAAYGAGDAERLVGRLVDEVAHRDDVVIASKAGFVVRRGERVVDTSRRALLRDLDASLARLGTDHLDLWQVHAWGDAPLEESLSAVDQAVTSGRVRYAGVSNFVGWQTAQAATWQRAVPGRTPLVSAQVEYSLLARRAEVEVLPALRAFGMGCFPWSPLGRGRADRAVPGRHPARAHGRRPSTSPGSSSPTSSRAAAASSRRSCRAAEGLDLTPLQVALLWVRDAPGVTAPLLGARTAGQLAPALATEDAAPCRPRSPRRWTTCPAGRTRCARTPPAVG